MDRFAIALWDRYFKEPVDSIPKQGDVLYVYMKKYLQTCKWFAVYDLLEFTVQNYPFSQPIDEYFVTELNEILKQEASGYRLIEGTVTPITDESEIQEIELALAAETEDPVRIHLQRALELLADREVPDYRNSIKESISAVEALCTLVVGNASASLGKALDKLAKNGSLVLHPALCGAFDKLYGYTSDADGIRHALLEEVTLDFDDAKFMLVACSAFVNYIRAKVPGAGGLTSETDSSES